MSPAKKKEPSMLAHGVGSLGSCSCCSPTKNNSNNPSLKSQSSSFSEDTEIIEKFTPKKKISKILAKSFKRLGKSEIEVERTQGFLDIIPIKNKCGFTARSARVNECSSFLQFSHSIYDTGEIELKGRLIKANFCKDRLCPMCNWRRSLKIFGQVSKIMDELGDNYEYVFLTLTVVNTDSSGLSDTIDSMNNAFHNLKRRKRFTSAVCGFHRVLEITINDKDGSYHPHFHCILAVRRNYYTSNLYIKHSEWLSMWQECMQDERIRFVNVKAIKPNNENSDDSLEYLKKAVVEVSKYSVKSADIFGKMDKDGNLIKPFPNRVIDSRVQTLALALAGRQLSVFGGCFFDTQKKLKLDDAENGDLLHLENEKIIPCVAELICTHCWGVGAYKMVNQNIHYLENSAEA